MYLEELTGKITLENLEVECKARLDRSNPQSWIKTVGGFSNATGGTFYIGAEDKTFKLIGFTRKDADNERNYFNNQINEHVSPRPQYTISFLRYEVNQRRLKESNHKEESKAAAILNKVTSPIASVEVWNSFIV